MKFGLLLLAAVAFAQTPAPEPPAPVPCLSAPVTKGTVTIACTVIDNSTYGTTTDAGIPNYLFQVRVTSTDPEVAGVRIEVSSVDAPPAGNPIATKRAVIAAKTGDMFQYTFAFSVSYDLSTLAAWRKTVTAVTVKELKPTSEQTIGN